MYQAALLFVSDAITTGNKSIGYVVCQSSPDVQRLRVSKNHHSDFVILFRLHLCYSGYSHSFVAIAVK